MKQLDSNIIVALIIAGAFLIGVFYITYNTDYKQCVRDKYDYNFTFNEPYEGDFSSLDMRKKDYLADAQDECADMFSSN